MADPLESPVNAGEAVTNPPPSLPLKVEDQFRLINQRLDGFADQLSRVAQPPQFRVADAVQFIVIFVGFVVAIFAAFNLSERIADVRADQAAMERRIIDNMSAAEARISPKLDKLFDLYTALAERISRLEGARATQPQKQ